MRMPTRPRRRTVLDQLEVAGVQARHTDCRADMGRCREWQACQTSQSLSVGPGRRTPNSYCGAEAGTSTSFTTAARPMSPFWKIAPIGSRVSRGSQRRSAQ